jgi:hypothetical protein
MFFPRKQAVRWAEIGAEHTHCERLKMGDFCALVDPSSGASGSEAIGEATSGANDATHIARLASYFAVCFGTGSGAPGAGGAATRGGA